MSNHHPPPGDTTTKSARGNRSGGRAANTTVPAPPGRAAATAFCRANMLVIFLLVVSSMIAADAKRLAGLGEFFHYVQNNGEVYGTGSNNYGALGLGSSESTFNTPQKMQLGEGDKVTDAAGGANHVCVRVAAAGAQGQAKAKCAGRGTNGELGRGTITTPNTMEAVAVLGDVGGVKEVFCGFASSYAIMEATGHVYAWGHNLLGSLGIGYTNMQENSPKPLAGPLSSANVSQIGASLYHAAFLTTAGDVWCTGFSQCSIGVEATGSNVISSPKQVNMTNFPEGTKFVSVSVGDFHTCAATTTGEVACWGWDTQAQLGGGGTVSTPMPIAGISNARAVWLGKSNTFVIDNNPLGSTAVAFGQDKYGVFGNGTVPAGGQSASPVPFGQNVTGIVEIRGGWKVTCILNVMDEVWCTGQQDYGQFGKGDCLATSTLLVEWGTPCTSQPTFSPTSSQPTFAPTSSAPTYSPTSSQPTNAPSNAPVSSAPSNAPSKAPVSSAPSDAPSKAPVSSAPSDAPSKAPVSSAPSNAPISGAPTSAPVSGVPTAAPISGAPTAAPISGAPTVAPLSGAPTASPISGAPTAAPISGAPTSAAVSSAPTAAPVASTFAPSAAPVSSAPTAAPAASTNAPSAAPVSAAPTSAPAAESNAPFTAPISSAPTAPTSAPVSAAPTAAPVAATLAPSTAPASAAPTAAPGSSVTDAPSTAPVAATSAPTKPANAICRPVVGTNKADCATLAKTCTKSKVTMLWAGAGCRVNGKLQHDGGCQCKDYCGYTCSKACTLSSRGRCTWNKTLKVCTVTKTKKPYVPRDTMYCPKD